MAAPSRVQDISHEGGIKLRAQEIKQLRVSLQFYTCSSMAEFE